MSPWVLPRVWVTPSWLVATQVSSERGGRVAGEGAGPGCGQGRRWLGVGPGCPPAPEGSCEKVRCCDPDGVVGNEGAGWSQLSQVHPCPWDWDAPSVSQCVSSSRWPWGLPPTRRGCLRLPQTRLLPRQVPKQEEVGRGGPPGVGWRHRVRNVQQAGEHRLVLLATDPGAGLPHQQGAGARRGQGRGKAPALPS